MSDSIGITLSELQNKPKKQLGRPKLPPKIIDDVDEIITCQCGQTLKKSNMHQHKNTTKHKVIMNIKVDTKNREMEEIRKDIESVQQLLNTLNKKVDNNIYNIKF